MTIPESLWNAWQPGMSWGDAPKMAEKSMEVLGRPINAATFRRALADRKCSEDTLKVMTQYYTERLNQIKHAEEQAAAAGGAL